MYAAYKFRVNKHYENVNMCTSNAIGGWHGDEKCPRRALQCVFCEFRLKPTLVGIRSNAQQHFTGYI